MKTVVKILLIILSLLTAVLDTSFFSLLPIFGATIVSTFSVLLILSLFENRQNYLVFVFSSIVFFSIFSSVQIWFLVLIFLAVPSILTFLINHYFPKFSILPAFMYFFVMNLLFQGVLTLFFGQLSVAHLKAIGSFAAINCLFTFIVYILIKLLIAKYYTGVKIQV